MRLKAWSLAAVLFSSPLSAQGWIEPLAGRSDPGVVKVRTSVTVKVTERVAVVEVEEWFENRASGGLGEGDYLYPLPGEAVFGSFSLFQGDEELRGETMDAERARAIYEEIVRRKKDPALIELVGHGLVRARVFPIQAGETRRITMRYTQVLKRTGDALAFRYAAGGRFAGVAAAGNERAQGPQRVSEPAPLSFTLTAENGARFRDPFSPTHEVRVHRDGRRMTVRPADRLSGDFALFLPLAGDAVGLTLAAHRPSGEDGWFMLTLSPGAAAESRVPRDVTVVVDVSGSMSGEKIEQARGALRQLLGTLGPHDRFRLVRFSSGVEAYRRDWSPATAAELRDAREWVDGLRAEGGTNISGALAEAFRATSPESRLPVVVFVTDGLPSAGETDPERIGSMAERDAGRARVFAFGVGYDVNTYMLDRIGAATRGSAEYVQPGEDVEQALGLLALKLRHPVLTDLAIGDAPVRIAEVYPRELPDLFAGEELVLFGRYEGSGRGTLAVTGRRSGRAERYATHAVFPDHEADHEYIPRLWASRKLGWLTQQIRLNGPDPELVDEVRRTALRHGLLSDYTSYLVLEPERAPLRAGAGVNHPAPAALAPAASVGRDAVRASERSREARSVRSAAELERVQKAAADEAPLGEAAGGRAGRLVAGRVFHQRDGLWVDALHESSRRVVRVEPFGEAYFALLERMPELKAYVTQLGRLRLAGESVSIEVAPGGARRIADRELSRIVREFRGR